MIGEEASPGWLERAINALPEGAVLRGIFLALVGVSGSIVYLDYQKMEAAALDAARLTRTEPMPLARPRPGDQIRPYLPHTIPVAPDRGEPKLPGYDGPVEGDALAASMRFIPGPDGELTALGRIDIGTAEHFREYLATSEGRSVRTVVLHSPGGSVDDAIEMARDIRSQHLSTRVPADGYCASACPLVLSGGVTRGAGEGAWIGVHQVYAVENPGAGLPHDIERSIADIQATTARCQNLLVDMGVDPVVWIKAMQTPADQLYVLTEAELSKYRMERPFPDDETFIGPIAPAWLLEPKPEKTAEKPASADAGPARAAPAIPEPSPDAERQG
ncbi:hypothetical protein [Aurantimonas sp. VKM B-3413]|uniref:COG3904 family protein n=1 Tax=Aurantimonas sp. VKM B-3413 TaxID=2779401 RepID=UPI001E45198F|nr:hypothetical protein [Aurantimonas sp. VKM B-3413]MCB8836519.1 hypothetical protein [Aurantimonas sp. VKM B-3413]